MKRHKFITSFSHRDGMLVIDAPAVVRQMKVVLHLGVGEECVVSDGHGVDFVVCIVDFVDNAIVCSVLRQETNANEPKVEVTLACAILKSDHFSLVVEKATEIGVRVIIPLVTARTIKKDVNLTRLEAVAREAAEQSDRGHVPVIAAPVPIARYIREASSPAVLLHQDGAEKMVIGDVAQTHVVVGPEGGWLEEEVAQMRSSGFLVRSLGKTIMRGETAAVVGSYLACHGLL